MRRFPSFAALVAFDAVARRGSFTAAAEDLGRTQSAVSHQVKRLEALFGTQLIDRRHPDIELTPEGATLAAELVPLLARLSRIGAQRHPQRPPRTLRIGVGSALSSLWLARRIPELLGRLETFDVELLETSGDEAPLPEAIDATIHWVSAAKVQASPTQRILFREDVFPVCHPSLIDRRAPQSLGDLARLGLLHKQTSVNYDGGPEWSWATWFRVFAEQASFAGEALARCARFTNIGTVLAAAMEGAGVALGRSLLVHDAIGDGRLVRPLSSSYTIPSSKVHVCLWHPEPANAEAVAAVVDWLTEAGRRTVEDIGSTPRDPVGAANAVLAE